ncbi:hypothetical protein DDP54_05915 [Cellulomonas sp. WB94]|uniref:hypothetical protein n=1 Tax=Cellulomonas sp. WB94 TaxID=2173174 RepID=UPI000D564426|nr:hypothetical protein [Cellulomonas sp. WB94]PVU82613.1 hypothetical protein DDP54_05915 [Cellulomonas sp. WB94]
MHTVVFGSSDGRDDEAAQAAMDAWRRRMPPDNELAGTLPVDTVLTRNADVAFTLRSLQVLSNGALLSFILHHRLDDEPGPIGPQRLAFDREVLVGVELADGSTATSFQGDALAGLGQGASGGPSLQPQSSGGGGRSYEISYWLTPRPAGDLTVVAASVTHHLPEGRVVIPGEAIAAAAGRGQMLWPREPDRQFRPDDVGPPDVPPGGWFARVLGDA